MNPQAPSNPEPFEIDIAVAQPNAAANPPAASNGVADTIGGAQFPSAFQRAAKPIPPKLYRIGEIVEYSGMSRQTIHNYTTMGLLQETQWTPGGHRLYDESVFGRLDHISQLKANRKSLEYIREFFANLDGR